MRSARRPLRVLALLLALAALTWLRFAMTAGGFRNSDDASNLLAGVEVAEGNWRLHGWIMATDNYYPTDVLAQAVLYTLFGFRPILMQGAEAAIWAAIAFVGIRLSLLDAPLRHWPGIVAIALSLLAFNQFDHAFRDSFLTTLPSHGSTILLTLLAFALFTGGHGRRAGIRLAGLGLVTAAGSLSDPVFDVIACLPMIGVCVLGLRRGADWRRRLPPICAVVVGVLAARWLLSLNARSGGFQSFGLSVTLATMPQLLQNLSFAVEAIARLLGAEFTGRTIDGQAAGGVMIHLLRIPFLIGLATVTVMLGGAVLREVRDWPGGAEPTRGEALDRLLWSSLVLCVASTVMTTVIVDPTCARFFLPATVAGSILMARQLGRVPLLAAYGLIMLPLSVVATLLSIPRVAPGQGIAIPQEARLVDTLLAHGLHHGYAGFWEANMTTVLSKRAVTSLPLLGGDDHRLHPLVWFDNLDWFRQAARDWDGRIFFVVSQKPAGLELSRDIGGPPVRAAEGDDRPRPVQRPRLRPGQRRRQDAGSVTTLLRPPGIVHDRQSAGRRRRAGPRRGGGAGRARGEVRRGGVDERGPVRAPSSAHGARIPRSARPTVSETRIAMASGPPPTRACASAGTPIHRGPRRDGSLAASSVSRTASEGLDAPFRAGDATSSRTASASCRRLSGRSAAAVAAPPTRSGAASIMLVRVLLETSGSGRVRRLLLAAPTETVTAIASTARMLEYEDVRRRPGTPARAGVPAQDAPGFLGGLCAVCRPVTGRGHRRPHSSDGGGRAGDRRGRPRPGRTASPPFNLRDLCVSVARFGVAAELPADIPRRIG